uniref:Uncharacterized protein n=1 Tax=Solanum lycopersicum TaxID=4081 RepID=A0A3Q7J532_SOLLC
MTIIEKDGNKNSRPGSSRRNLVVIIKNLQGRVGKMEFWATRDPDESWMTFGGVRVGERHRNSSSIRRWVVGLLE